MAKFCQRDALSVLNEAYSALLQLRNTGRNNSETMENFESRFSAQVAKFNSITKTTKFPECIAALMLLSSFAINDSQRVSVMAAAASSDENLTSQSSNDQFLSSIIYQPIPSVIKQCDKTLHDATENGPLAASSAGTSHFGGQARGCRTRNKG